MRKSLIEIYDERAERGELRADQRQRKLLGQLESLRLWLEEQGPKASARPALLRAFARKPPPAPRGLYLWGGVGRGKSMLMDLFIEATAQPQKRRVHFHTFMQEVHKALHVARQTEVDDALAPVAGDIAANLHLLAIDEMQITDITDAMIVGRLFDMLFGHDVVIVTTSNRPPEDLYLDGLNRQLFVPFIELLRARLDVEALDSSVDYRQHRLAGTQVFFAPANAAARAAIDALWADLAGPGPASAHEIEVNGRKLRLERMLNGVARATFWELCAQPLGPADYLALASAVRVLILEQVPSLSASNYNEAKRFVTLIDALYEARVRLILSAADVPERLYIEGSGAFEFERTASRLREMMAADWSDDQNGQRA